MTPLVNLFLTWIKAMAPANQQMELTKRGPVGSGGSAAAFILSVRSFHEKAKLSRADVAAAAVHAH